MTRKDQILTRIKLLGENPVACNDWGIVTQAPSHKYRLVNINLLKLTDPIFLAYNVGEHFIVLDKASQNNNRAKKALFVGSSMTDKIGRFGDKAEPNIENESDEIIAVDNYNAHKFTLINKNGKSKSFDKKTRWSGLHVIKQGTNLYALMVKRTSFHMNYYGAYENEESYKIMDIDINLNILKSYIFQ